MSRRETSAWNPVPIEIGPVLARKYRYAFFLVPCLLAGLFVMAALRTFKVDDAFMFYRYALHFRQGLGVAWNPDGVPTYGLTSLGWFLIVLLFSFLPLKAVAVLILASGATGMLALLLMSWGITRFAVSHAMRSLWVALPLVALPLLLQPQFDLEIINGMETMLSVLTNALLVLAVLYAMRQPTTRSAVLLGLSGYLAFFVRPDNGLCAALVPLMLWLFWSPFQFRIALVAELCLFSLIGVQLLLAYRYFGTPVPLAFYIKAIGGYKGYIPPVNPGVQFSSFLFFAAPYLGAAAMTIRNGSDRRLLAIFALPALLTCLYLLTVTQIMGYNARYYVPFLPFLILPSLLVVDQWVAHRETAQNRPSGTRRYWIGRGAVAVAAISGVIGLTYLGSQAWFANANKKITLYDVPQRVIAATKPLPASGYFQQFHAMGDTLLSHLPPGTTLAASEVGYIGASAPQIRIIDIVGLNDKQIALHGFSMQELLQSSPDVIWLPHPDYTWLLHEIWTDPSLLDKYDVYEGAFLFGIAVRKDSLRYREIEDQLAKAWETLYPRTAMQSYRVQAILSPSPAAAEAETVSVQP